MTKPFLVVPAALLIAVALTACGTQSGSQAQPQRVKIEGTVTSAPSCPVQQIGTPCPPRASAAVTVQALRKSLVIATTSTDTHGHYVLAVPAGDYSVRASAGSGYPATVTKHVAATRDVTLDLVLESGIR